MGGRTYTARNLSRRRAGTFPLRRQARVRADRYPVGRAVTVHYDPADPARATLDPGHSWFYLLGLPLAGLAVAFFGLTGIIAGIRGVR